MCLNMLSFILFVFECWPVFVGCSQRQALVNCKVVVGLLLLLLFGLLIHLIHLTGHHLLMSDWHLWHECWSEHRGDGFLLVDWHSKHWLLLGLKLSEWKEWEGKWVNCRAHWSHWGRIGSWKSWRHWLMSRGHCGCEASREVRKAWELSIGRWDLLWCLLGCCVGNGDCLHVHQTEGHDASLFLLANSAFVEEDSQNAFGGGMVDVEFFCNWFNWTLTEEDTFDEFSTVFVGDGGVVGSGLSLLDVLVENWVSWVDGALLVLRCAAHLSRVW